MSTAAEELPDWAKAPTPKAAVDADLPDWAKAPAPVAPAASAPTAATPKPTSEDELRDRMLSPLGLPEAALSMGTGTIASALGGLAGLARTALPGKPGAGADVSQAIQQALTYQPRTKAGKQTVEGISLLNAPFDWAAKKAGEGTLEASKSPLMATIAETGIQNLPALVGMGMKGVSSKGAPTIPPRYPAGHPKVDIPTALMEKGIKLTPSMTEHPSEVGRLLEGISGKAQLEKKLSQVNENVINEMAVKDLGLPPGTPINKTTTKPIIDRYTGLRDQIDNIPATFAGDPQLAQSVAKIAGDQLTTWKHRKQKPPPEFQELIDIIEQKTFTPKYLQAEIRLLRDKASDNLTKASGDTQLGRSQKAAANALEEYLGRQLQASHPELIKQFQEARKMTAKVYDYLEATSQLGDVNAPRFADYTADKKITGEGKDIATLGAEYSKAAQPLSTSGGYQPHSQWDMAAGTAALMGGKPYGALEFIAGRPLARDILASKWGQNKFVRPNTAPTPPSTFAQAKQVMKNNPAVASIAKAPFTDAEKERRYQAWKARMEAMKAEAAQGQGTEATQ